VARIRYRRAAKAARETQAKLDRAHRLAAREQAKEAAKARKAAALATKANRATLPPPQGVNTIDQSSSGATGYGLPLASAPNSGSCGNEEKEVAAPLRSPIWDTFETPIQSPVPSPPHSPRHRKCSGYAGPKINNGGLQSNVDNGPVASPPPPPEFSPLLTVGASVQVRDGYRGEWQSGFVHGVCRVSGRPKVKVLGHRKAFEWDEWRFDHGPQPLSTSDGTTQPEVHRTLPVRDHSAEQDEGDEEDDGALNPPLSSSPITGGLSTSGGRRAQRGWLGGLLSEERLERRAESRRRQVRRRKLRLEKSTPASMLLGSPTLSWSYSRKMYSSS